jgi:hypothetical protein
MSLALRCDVVNQTVVNERDSGGVCADRQKGVCD